MAMGRSCMSAACRYVTTGSVRSSGRLTNLVFSGQASSYSSATATRGQFSKIPNTKLSARSNSTLSSSSPVGSRRPSKCVTSSEAQADNTGCCCGSILKYRHLQDHYPSEPTPELERQVRLHRQSTIDYNMVEPSPMSQGPPNKASDEARKSLGSNESDQSATVDDSPDIMSQPEETDELEGENEEQRHERRHKNRIRAANRHHITNVQYSNGNTREGSNNHQDQHDDNNVNNGVDGQGQMADQKHQHHHHHHHHHHHDTNGNTNHENHNHRHHHHHHHHHRIPHHHHDKGGHIKELIKPDRPERAPRSLERARNEPPPITTSTSGSTTGGSGVAHAESSSSRLNVATAVDEEQLHARLVSSRSSRSPSRDSSNCARTPTSTTTSDERVKSGAKKSVSSLKSLRSEQPPAAQQTLKSSGAVDSSKLTTKTATNKSKSKSFTDSSHSSTARSHSDDDKTKKSPPPAAIIIPANVVESLSSRQSSSVRKALRGLSPASSEAPKSSPITKEQLEYGPLLKTGEVQVLYRSPELPGQDRQLKDEHAKAVAPRDQQSPILLSATRSPQQSISAPLHVEWPSPIENLRLNNTGQFWDIKIPYQISINSSVTGANLAEKSSYKLDQFHCHWGTEDGQGSEHSVDGQYYSAELHFVHYNLDKYRNMSMAARQPDGLVVIGVFLDAQPDYPNHPELDKIVSHIQAVPLKGEHIFIKQPVKVDSLLPANKSYWSYHGSLTTPPFFESVTWFMMKTPVKISLSQLHKFRALKSSLRHESGHQIVENRRPLQPLNGREIIEFDEHTKS